MQIANRLQVPSYLSLTSALTYHALTTQVQQGYFESIATRRSKAYQAGGHSFVFHKIQGNLFTGLTRLEGIFVAEPEKALLDGAYLEILGHTRLDWAALDLSRIDPSRLATFLELYPKRYQQRMAERCRI